MHLVNCLILSQCRLKDATSLIRMPVYCMWLFSLLSYSEPGMAANSASFSMTMPMNAPPSLGDKNTEVLTMNHLPYSEQTLGGNSSEVTLPFWLTAMLLLILVSCLALVCVMTLQVGRYQRNTKQKSDLIRQLKQQSQSQQQVLNKTEQEVATLKNQNQQLTQQHFGFLASDLKNPLAVIQTHFIGWLKQSKLSDVMLEKARLIEKSIDRIEGIVEQAFRINEAQDHQQHKWVRLTPTLAYLTEIFEAEEIALQGSGVFSARQFAVEGSERNLNLLLNTIFHKALKHCYQGSKARLELHNDGDHLTLRLSAESHSSKSEHKDGFLQSIGDAAKPDYPEELIATLSDELDIKIDYRSDHRRQTTEVSFYHFKEIVNEEQSADVPVMTPAYFDTAQVPVISQPARTHSTDKAPKCLVLEPCPEMQICLLQCLSQHFNCKGLFSWQHTQEQIDSWQPDLLVMEIEPDTKETFTLLRQLRDTMSTTHLPVLIVTTQASTENRLKALDVDVAGVFEKPFSEELLCKTALKIHQNGQKQAQQKIVRENVDFQPSRDAIFLSQLNALVETHIGNANFTFEDYFEQFALSKRQFFRRVNSLTRCTPKQYLIQKRLELARHLFSQGALLSEVTKQCGFKTEKSLLKIYEAHYGETVI